MARQERRLSKERPGLSTVLSCLALAGLVLAVYGQTLSHGFVTFDDPVYVSDNPAVAAGLSWEGFKWAFSFQGRSYWHPLTWLSFQFDASLWGPSAWGFHLGNLALHLGVVLCLFLFLARTTGERWASLFAAALMAVHPMHAESVAWITERKDVLSGLFWMLTLLAYARYAERPSAGRMALVLAGLCLGLMSKPVLVALPFVMFLADFWPLRRLDLDEPARPAPRGRLEMARPGRDAGQVTVFKLVTEKIWLVLPCAAASALVLLSHPGEGFGGAPVSLGLKLSNALVGYWWYLAKFFWPSGLIVHYPFPAAVAAWKAILAGLGLAAVTAWVLAGGRRRPHLAVGWFWFLVTLMPMLNVFGLGLRYATADRFAYIPYMGLYLALSFEAARLITALRMKRAVVLVLAGLALAPLALAGVRQAGYWKDSRTLYDRALSVDPENWFARDGLGGALLLDGGESLPLALENLQEAVRLNPTYPEARHNLGRALLALGRPRESLGAFQEAVRLRPTFALAHASWAEALNRLGLPLEAVEHAHTALKLNPGLAEAENAWGLALARLGKPEEALPHFQSALALKPKLAEAQVHWGAALNQLGKPEEAVPHFQAALALRPEMAEAMNNLGNSYLRLNRLDEAAAQYREAVRLKPDLAEGWLNLGMATLLQNKPKESIPNFQEALRLRPELADAHVGWGQALFKLRRGDEALMHYDEALKVRPGDANILALMDQARVAPPPPAKAPAKTPDRNAGKAPAKPKAPAKKKG